MRELSKGEALSFIDEHAAVLDAPSNPVNPFASSVWLKHFVAQVASEDWTMLAPMGEHGTSLMLLYHGRQAPFQCEALTNYYSSLFSPLASSETDRAHAVASLVQQLGEHRPRLRTAKFAPLSVESPDTGYLEAALAEQGWYVRRYFSFGNWSLPCEGMTFDKYLSSRDSQLRHTLARKSKKLQTAGRLQIFTRAEDVDSAMDAFESVYSKSWKVPEPYPSFVREWARLCAERGWLRLGVASIDDVPIAAQFWFTTARRAYIFKLAYDEGQSRWSAGTVLTAHLLRHALEVDQVIEVDYLSGDDAYKKSWMTVRRERIGLMACNLRSVGGAAAAATEVLGQATAWFRHRRVADVS
jgi:hypothetical protein